VIARLERQSGMRCQIVRSDNGTEFVNKLVAAFCERNGIIHQTTVPYTSEQNGIAERAIAVYFEMVRCMLHSSRMDLRYWGEAFLYAIHIRNLSPTSGLEGKVPYHAWTGRKPDVSHLRVFGSIGYANIPKKVRGGKLEPTAAKCRLLGWWAEETKGYRLEDIKTGKLITSRDVKFIEDEQPTDLAIIEGGNPPGVLSELTSDDLEASKLTESTPTSSDPHKERENPETPDSASEDSPATTNEPAQPRATQTSKWASLPLREPSTRLRKDTAHHGVPATEEEIVEAENRRIEHRAYVVYASEPRSYQEAISSPHSKQWEKAMSDEFEQLKRTGTFEWVEAVPEGRKVVGSRWVWKEKRNEQGNLAKHKARIVAQGFSQVPGQDFNGTYASVAKFTTLRALLAIAAREDWEVHQVDVRSAYLQGDLEEEIYMRVPEGIVEPGKEGWLWRLLKAIYGLKQAGRQWKKKLDEIMRELGFEKSAADDCLYILRRDGVIIVVVLVYVDDMTVAGPKLKDVVEFKAELGKRLDITDLGELKYILGIEVIRNRAARTITLNQTAYIVEILSRYGMRDCAPVSTPLVATERLTAAQGPATPDEKQAVLDYANGASYPERVGSLLYATQTRPDIQYAVALLAQFSANPGKPHFEAVKRVLRYLKGTAQLGLTFGGSGSGVDLIGWTDSDWAQDPDSRRSVGGFVFDVAGGSVSWSSKKQPTVALSTVEAEYMAASNATKEAIWLRTLLDDLGFTQVQATTIHADNQGCIALSRNPVSHSRAKHIDIRHHFIRERVANKEIDLQFCSTKDMLADIFTKALPREAFEKFRAALGVGE
jgi:hypothetical protein